MSLVMLSSSLTSVNMKNIYDWQYFHENMNNDDFYGIGFSHKNYEIQLNRQIKKLTVKCYFLFGCY